MWYLGLIYKAKRIVIGQPILSYRLQRVVLNGQSWLRVTAGLSQGSIWKLLKHFIFFNDIPVDRCSTYEHLGMYLDEKLNFCHQITENFAKANKVIDIIKKLHVLPRRALLTIYKCFIRPDLDYGNFINDQPNNDSFCSKIESFQYNAAVATTGAIRGASQTKYTLN